MKESSLMTVSEVARMLRVSEGWVRDHATRRRPLLPVVRLGRLLRFRRCDIEEFLQLQREKWDGHADNPDTLRRLAVACGVGGRIGTCTKSVRTERSGAGTEAA